MRLYFSMMLMVVLLLAAENLSAQVDQKYRIGMVFTPQISWLKTDNNSADNGSGLFGYNFGVSVDRFFTPNYAINTGLTINTTGGVLTYGQGLLMNIGDKTELLKKVTYRLKYIEVPVALKLRTNDFGRLAYYGVFGMSAQIGIKSTDGNDNEISDYVRDLNTAYHFGGGAEYSLGGSTYLLFGLQFHNGLNDITKHPDFRDKAILNRLVFNMGLIF
ncbi:outer membrane protein with beta-barrel domain [Breznakibacter xylanolyticus]|uniref:Outer membrane protein with beta-barrel domain n=1 Tax=Breznakibacter xylanolyticus TaxID=990 RepID=A0A2W7NK22_9BACT|nr:porin family protein [Breznakibacter xylanolyticus]PZX20775.1 outer membrane protein with beta-barrel domain [Breznakibacter xylanolyticus]